MKIFAFFLVSIFGQPLYAQSEDIKYREDQIYVGLSYPILSNDDFSITQNKFSHRLYVGFVRDIPLNKKRTFGLGVGLGYNHTILYSNLMYNNFFETLQSASDYKENKWQIGSVELPFEFRWRTSTPTQYKFWRIYSGITSSYEIIHSSFFKPNEGEATKNDLPTNKFKIGYHINIGNNTWNIRYYYALNQFFKSQNHPNINFSSIGLIFYIF